MKCSVKGLLYEAYRRNDMADAHERSKPLSERWLGLGTAAAYRPALAARLMRFHDGRTPEVRCMGWLCLTETGIKEMRKHEKEFKRVLDLLKEGDYGRSYAAHYMLAGGIVTQ